MLVALQFRNFLTHFCFSILFINDPPPPKCSDYVDQMMANLLIVNWMECRIQRPSANLTCKLDVY